MQTKQFHIGDILSVSHDRLVSPRHIEGCYDILNFMTGDNLFTHQLPRAARICKPALFKQHPQLKEADSSGVNAENWRDWLKEQVEKFGETLPVAPLESDEYNHVNPIQEAVEMVGEDRVIVASV